MGVDARGRYANMYVHTILARRNGQKNPDTRTNRPSDRQRRRKAEK